MVYRPRRTAHYPEADHGYHSRVVVANLRAALTRGGPDARAATIVRQLREESDEFATLWDQHEVAVRREDHKRIVHPELGIIELDCQSCTPRIRRRHC